MVDAAKIKTSELTSRMTLTLKMPRTFSLRMRVGAWLIGLAGRVMHMPCQIDIVTDLIKPGDVVKDRWSKRLMTVEYVHGEDHHCVWFEGSTLHRGNFKAGSLLVI